MYTIDYLKQLSNYTVKTWVHNHMYDTDGNLSHLAAHHELIDGQLKFRMITYDEFFQYIETDIHSDEITFNFIGCGIKGPFNLFLTIKNELSEDYLKHLPDEFKHQIIQYVSCHEYLKKICDSYHVELPEPKQLMGMFYLSYMLDYKNEIYDILLDYKMRVIQYHLEI